jgi:hypothetical protein
MSVGGMEDYKLIDLRASHTLVVLGRPRNQKRKEKKNNSKVPVLLSGHAIKGSIAHTCNRLTTR